MNYLLDSNIITKFQSAGQLPALCRAASYAPIHLIEEVYDELTFIKVDDHPQIQAKKNAARRLIDGSKIVIDEIFPESPESRLLSKLRTGKTSSRDLGEAACVALAFHRPEFVFVCGDKNGVLSALNELHGSGERVLRPHVFLRRIVRDAAVTALEAQACAGSFREFGVLPSWWTDWLAEISAAG